MHTARDEFGREIMEYDETFTGKVTLTYMVKADSIDAANECLRDIAASLSKTGVIGITSGGRFRDGDQVSGGFHGKLKKSDAGNARAMSKN